MALVIYHVMRGGDGWIVRLDDRDYGHLTLTSALRAAITAARTSAEHGHETQVLVQRPDTSWIVTWTSEDDFSWGSHPSEVDAIEPSEPAGACPPQSAGGSAAER